MRPKKRAATDAELAVLKELWAAGPMSARSLTERLYETCSASEIATVQKLLRRLEEKCYVDRERRPPAHLFRATITQSELAGEQLEAMAEKLCGGSMTPFVTHLIDSRGLSPEERAEIRKLVDGQ